MTYETLSTEQHGHAALIRLNRPEALNALNSQMIEELNKALDKYGRDDHILSVILTGSDTVFCAGADVKEMQELDYQTAYRQDFLQSWNQVSQFRKPLIAAVAGHALGGGLELAMMCDFILAGDNAKFGLPEVKLGVIPGIGGTQRLPRFIGKSKAMEMVLTGRIMAAEEAESAGLVSRVLPVSGLLPEAIKVSENIADLSLPSLMMAKSAINTAYETTLHEGTRIERQLFYSLFAYEDQAEGMAAFIEKRSPHFKHK